MPGKRSAVGESVIVLKPVVQQQPSCICCSLVATKSPGFHGLAEGRDARCRSKLCRYVKEVFLGLVRRFPLLGTASSRHQRTSTCTALVVSLPRMSMTFTRTVNLPGRS